MIVRFRAPDRDRAVGRRVQDARRRQRRTQTDLARLIGVSPSMMGKLERGERHWTLEAIVMAAQAMGLPPEFILGETLGVLHMLVTPDPEDEGRAASKAPASRISEINPDVLDLSTLDETDRTMIVAMHAVMANRTARMAA